MYTTADASSVKACPLRGTFGDRVAGLVRLRIPADADPEAEGKVQGLMLLDRGSVTSPLTISQCNHRLYELL